MVDCHLFLTVRNRARSVVDPPFAFAYLPFFPSASSTFQSDGAHTLVLYRYDKQVASPSFYFQVPPVHDSPSVAPSVPPAVSKTLVPLRDTITLATQLVSTEVTQNQTILRLVQWQRGLIHDPELVRDTLAKLTFCPEIQVCTFLRCVLGLSRLLSRSSATDSCLPTPRSDILDALFGLLGSSANSTGELDDLLFQALVGIFGFESDKRLPDFRPALELYISQSFSSSAAAAHIVGSLQRLLRTPAAPETAKTLRASVKVWRWLLRVVVRSREIQRAREPGSGTTASTLEAGFKNDVLSLLARVNSLMRTTAPASIIGTQTLVLQHFPAILPELGAIFDVDELLEVAIGFVDSVGAVKGKMPCGRSSACEESSRRVSSPRRRDAPRSCRA